MNDLKAWSAQRVMFRDVRCGWNLFLELEYSDDHRKRKEIFWAQ